MHRLRIVSTSSTRTHAHHVFVHWFPWFSLICDCCTQKSRLGYAAGSTGVIVTCQSTHERAANSEALNILGEVCTHTDRHVFYDRTVQLNVYDQIEDSTA